MKRSFLPKELLVDGGFDQEFGWERLNEFTRLFADDGRLQSFVHEIHQRDHAYDLKRGEFYPEILRAVLSLKRVVSRYYEIDEAQVHPNFGSNGSIDTLLSAAKVAELVKEKEWISERVRMLAESNGEKGDEARAVRAELKAGPPWGGVLASSPTYFRNYNSAAARQLAVHLVKLREDWSLDAKRFISEMQRLRPTAALLVTPNNPTGIPIPDEDICAILDCLPAETWAVLDRTLVNTRKELDSRDILKRYRGRNVVILHSFSKYQGLSHLRVGVALHANAELARQVAPMLPLGLGLEACVKASRLVVIHKGIHASENILRNISENRKLLDGFVARNSQYSITDFSGNYALLLLPSGQGSENVATLLCKHGFYTMPGHEFPEPAPSVIRLHVGGPVEYLHGVCEVLERDRCDF